MRCPVCEYEKSEKICENCGSTVSMPKYKYVKPEALSAGDAEFHFNALRNPVKVGFVQISTSLRKATLLDIQGQLSQATELIGGLVKYEVSGLKVTRTTHEYDFIYLGSHLQHLQHPKEFLKQLRACLKPKGVVEFFVPQNTFGCYFIFAMPAFYALLQLCGYTVIERTIIEMDSGVLVCAQ